MKSPNDLSNKLSNQWKNADLRERRLLSTDEWPLELRVGAPSAKLVIEHPGEFRSHLNKWKAVTAGTVHWEDKSYRDISAPVSVPKYWRISSPSEWVAVCNNIDIKNEFSHMGRIVENTDKIFHSLILRQRNLVMARNSDEVILTAKVVMELAPSCANGRPLRALSIAGCDSKFFERNRSLIIQMLILRFGDVVNDIGLEKFLDALDENDHWLLVAPLTQGLLPFEQQRVRARELLKRELPGTHIIIVENEKCLYQLPMLPGTIAILGSGQNLKWLSAEWLKGKSVAYWGDIDTWGLCMLSTARRYIPKLIPLMMNMSVYDAYGAESAVSEPETAGGIPPEQLNDKEIELYKFLVSQDKGRLEQEFIPREFVKMGVELWISNWEY
ncbi:hypothetical protein A9Q81_08295 [Gammaproteobacteria bacterium 42_54_T18]|nr:hypothetical protein A9Q81_08295 [Gammaproteobacteria bacterium 42_54_T18]